MYLFRTQQDSRMNQVSLNPKTFSKLNFYSIRMVIYTFWLEIEPLQKSKKLVLSIWHVQHFSLAVSKMYGSVSLRLFL